MATKQTYARPELTKIGTFESLTQGSQDGESLDATFPANTPRGELTFSD